jgi:hypothetical protein
MQVPAAMFIESAADTLKALPEWIRTDEVKELRSFGDARAKQLGATGVSTDFEAGYVLGLQVARVILATNIALEKAGVDPQTLL